MSLIVVPDLKPDNADWIRRADTRDAASRVHRIARKIQEGTKGSASSGWHAPPKGTHGPGSQGGSADAYTGLHPEVAKRVRDYESKFAETRKEDAPLHEVGYFASDPETVPFQDRYLTGNRTSIEMPVGLRYQDGVFTHFHPNLVPTQQVEEGQTRISGHMWNDNAGITLPPSRSDAIYMMQVGLSELRTFGYNADGDVIVYRLRRNPSLEGSNYQLASEMESFVNDRWGTFVTVHNLSSEVRRQFGTTLEPDEILPIMQMTVEAVDAWWRYVEEETDLITYEAAVL